MSSKVAIAYQDTRKLWWAALKDPSDGHPRAFTPLHDSLPGSVAGWSDLLLTNGMWQSGGDAPLSLLQEDSAFCFAQAVPDLSPWEKQAATLQTPYGEAMWQATEVFSQQPVSIRGLPKATRVSLDAGHPPPNLEMMAVPANTLIPTLQEDSAKLCLDS